MQPTKFLTGRLADGSAAWAAIDATAHHLQPQVGERRFAAYLTPFPTEEAARQALLEVGAVNFEAEARKRRGAT